MWRFSPQCSQGILGDMEFLFWYYVLNGFELLEKYVEDIQTRNADIDIQGKKI